MRRYLAGILALDVVLALAAGFIAYLVRFADARSGHHSSSHIPFPIHDYFWLSLILPVIWVVALALAGAFDERVLGTGSEEFARVGRAAIGLTAAIGFLSYAAKAEIARGYVVVALPLVTLMCLVGRYALRKLVHRLRASGRCMSDVVVVGGAYSAAELIVQLQSVPHSGLRVVGACVPDDSEHSLLDGLDVPIVGNLGSVGAAVTSTGADTVAVTACPELGSAGVRRISWELEGSATDLLVAPGLMEVAGPRLHIRPLTGLPLLHVEEPDFTGSRRLLKSLIDKTVALIGLIVLSPVFIVIALVVRFTSPGPVLFRQTRVGKDGREFTMLKFRSMVADADAQRAAMMDRNEHGDGLMFKVYDDPRITPVGKVLRRCSLDELPQLINIFAGSMSLVGPRPPLLWEFERYADDARRRLLVKPGLTGLWQISGRSDLTWDEMVRLDLRYVENWTLTLDLMILWKTFFVVIRGSGAY